MYGSDALVMVKTNSVINLDRLRMRRKMGSGSDEGLEFNPCHGNVDRQNPDAHFDGMLLRSVGFKPLKVLVILSVMTARTCHGS